MRRVEARIALRETLVGAEDVGVAGADERRFRALVERLGNTSMVSAIGIARDGDVLVEGRIVHIFVRADRLGEKATIPDHVRRILQPYTVQDHDSLATSTITDAPTIRSLKFALQDEFDDWRDGEMLLQSLIDTPDKVDRASARQAELEKLYLASGGIAGPGSLGEPV